MATKTEAFLTSTAQFLSETNVLMTKWSPPATAPPAVDPTLRQAPIETSHMGAAQTGVSLPPIRLAVDEVDRVKQLIADHDKSKMANNRLSDALQPLVQEATSIINRYANGQSLFVRQTDMDRLVSAMQALTMSADRCDKAWKQRSVELQNMLWVKCFERDARKLLDWVEDNQQIVLLQFDDIGHSTLSAQELQSAHDQFYRTCLLNAESAHSIESLRSSVYAIIDQYSKSGNRIHMTVAVVQRIQLQLSTLEHCWQTFKSILDSRGKLLSASLNFHRKVDELSLNCLLSRFFVNDRPPSLQYSSQIPEWMSECGKTLMSEYNVKSLEEISHAHHDLSDNIGRSYAEVCYWGKIILDVLKREHAVIGDCQSESAQMSMAYIYSVVNKAFHHQKSLEKAWVEKRIFLQDLTRKAIYLEDVAQVSRYISDHGENFLTKNKSIGRSLTRARALLEAHVQFEMMMKNTIKHARQLIDAAICGSFSPSSSLNNERISALCQNNDNTNVSHDEFSGAISTFAGEIRVASSLESKLKKFIDKVDQRRGLLTRAVAYYTHFKELTICLKDVENKMGRRSPMFSESAEQREIDEFDRQIQQLSLYKDKGVEACERVLNEGTELASDLR
ncbi:hypothetical protein ACOME3_008330 [Neoechinorhynchus agilis]